MNKKKYHDDDPFPDYRTTGEYVFLLPLNVSEAVEKAAERAELERREEAARKRAEYEARAEEKLDNSYARRQEEEKAEKERLAALDNALPPLPAWKLAAKKNKRAFMHTVFSQQTIDRYKQSVETRSSKETKEKQRLNKLARYWEAIGGMRKIAHPKKGWQKALGDIANEMPNFRLVTEYLAGELTLAEKSKKPVRLAPMLLDGPPGVGKTTFARKLAQLFGSSFLSISMETAQTASTLSGSEEYWGNSKPGQLFGLLVEGEFANPVVLIDEIDKSSTRDYDPASALYGLLEPTSAASWHDLAIPSLNLDASRVLWILTSNNKAMVSKPLLSRMRVFDIPGLSREQSREAACRIFAGAVRDMGIEFANELPWTMAAVLATTSPREMHRVARELVAKAVVAGRDHVIQKDLNDMDLDQGVLDQWKIVSVVVEVADVANSDGTAVKH